MSDQDELNPAERELEAALKSLTPRTAQLNPVAAAYIAGQLSTRREMRRWKFATAAIALLGAGGWLLPAGEYLLAVKEARVPVVVVTTPEMGRVAEQSLVALQRVVWEKGVDGLVPVQPAPSKGIRIDDVLSTLKGKS